MDEVVREDAVDEEEHEDLADVLKRHVHDDRVNDDLVRKGLRLHALRKRFACRKIRPLEDVADGRLALAAPDKHLDVAEVRLLLDERAAAVEDALQDLLRLDEVLQVLLSRKEGKEREAKRVRARAELHGLEPRERLGHRAREDARGRGDLERTLLVRAALARVGVVVEQQPRNCVLAVEERVAERRAHGAAVLAEPVHVRAEREELRADGHDLGLGVAVVAGGERAKQAPAGLRVRAVRDEQIDRHRREPEASTSQRCVKHALRGARHHAQPVHLAEDQR